MNFLFTNDKNKLFKRQNHSVHSDFMYGKDSERHISILSVQDISFVSRHSIVMFGNLGTSAYRVDVVILRTRVHIPPQNADNFQPSPSGGSLPTCCIDSITQSSVISVKWSIRVQHGIS